MALDVGYVIPVTTTISGAGVSTANFGSACLFAPSTERPSGLTADTKHTYTTLKAVAADGWSTTSETYLAASKWFSSTPVVKSLTIWCMNSADASLTATLNKARNIFWWYFTFFTKDVYATASKITEAVVWGEANEAFVPNCQTGTLCTAIRDENTTTDIASVFVTAGYRHTATLTHATDPYAGIALCKHFAKVNFNVSNSTITGEFKKSPGVTAEDLTDSAMSAMQSDKKKAAFYSVVSLQGSTDSGEWINTWTPSTYGEFMDDVFNLDAFVNAVKVAAYNAIRKQTTKLAQTPVGQAVLIGAVKAVCEQFVSNNYLGPRDYIDPDDGLEKYTAGYEILTKAEDILDTTDTERDNRYAAPIKIRIFRAGAIHFAPVDITVE